MQNNENQVDILREHSFVLVSIAEALINNGNYGDSIPIMAKAVIESRDEEYSHELRR